MYSGLDSRFVFLPYCVKQFSPSSVFQFTELLLTKKCGVTTLS